MNFLKRMILLSFFSMFSSIGFSSEIAMWCSYQSGPDLYQINVQFNLEEEQLKRKIPFNLKGARVTFSQMSSSGWRALQDQMDSHLIGTVRVHHERLVLVSVQKSGFEMSFTGSIHPRFQTGIGRLALGRNSVENAECSSFLTLGPRPGFTVSN